MAHSVQTLYDDALGTHGKMLSLPEQHGRHNRPCGSLRSGQRVNNESLRHPTAVHQVRWASVSHVGPGAHYRPTFVPNSQTNFKKLLKTHLFSLTYSRRLLLFLSCHVFNFVIM